MTVSSLEVRVNGATKLKPRDPAHAGRIAAKEPAMCVGRALRARASRSFRTLCESQRLGSVHVGANERWHLLPRSNCRAALHNRSTGGGKSEGQVSDARCAVLHACCNKFGAF